jgi:hypothetical protein
MRDIPLHFAHPSTAISLDPFAELVGLVADVAGAGDNELLKTLAHCCC